MIFIASIAAYPAFTSRLQDDLSTPGLRLPLNADAQTFAAATAQDRLASDLPRIPKDRAIPDDSDAMPDTITYDTTKKRLLIGTGYVENVEPAVWSYEVSGKQVLLQWFSYRKQNRERPVIGDRRPPSPLGNIQPDHWLAEYTTELLNVLNVHDLLVALEPAQAALQKRFVLAQPPRQKNCAQMEPLSCLRSPGGRPRSLLRRTCFPNQISEPRQTQWHHQRLK
jgi:hypothetical protein